MSKKPSAAKKAAPKKAAPKKVAVKKVAPKMPAAPKPTVTPPGLRTLGRPGARPATTARPTQGRATAPPAPERSRAQAAAARKAKTTLEQEFGRVLAMKEKLAAEAHIGASEKGRESLRQPEKLRTLVASLEGMSRFAIAMGLLTPAENRDVWTAAMARGLYEGWR